MGRRGGQEEGSSDALQHFNRLSPGGRIVVRFSSPTPSKQNLLNICFSFERLKMAKVLDGF